MVSWKDGRVTTADSVDVAAALSGETLRDSYVAAVGTLTFGLARLRRNTVHVGPVEMLRFGEPQVGADFVEWPIEGGLLARPGGRWRIESQDHTVRATAVGHRPTIPRPIYDVSHLQVHQLLTHLYLLRLRGPEPAPGRVAAREDRLRAAAVDVALCLTVAGLAGLRRPRRTLLLTAGYHVACWSLFGRTLGGLVLRQRVVSVDGSRVRPTQAAYRLALLPFGWIARRPVHDELAATAVIED